MTETRIRFRAIEGGDIEAVVNDVGIGITFLEQRLDGLTYAAPNAMFSPEQLTLLLTVSKVK